MLYRNSRLNEEMARTLHAADLRLKKAQDVARASDELAESSRDVRRESSGMLERVKKKKVFGIF